MKTDIRLTPESEEEVKVLEKLSEVREYALEEAEMNPASVGGIFAQMAAGLCSESERNPPAEADLECPECGTPITDVTGNELGAEPIVEPCGCEVGWDQLPPELYFDST